MKQFITIFLIIAGGSLFGQEYADKDYYLIDSLVLADLEAEDRALIDSCLNVFHTTNQDTSKVNAVTTIIAQCWDELLWPRYNRWLYSFVQKQLVGEMDATSLQCIKRSLAETLNNFGVFNDEHGNIPLALEYYHKSLRIYEDIGDKYSIAYTYNNIGYVQRLLGNQSVALDYFKKSLQVHRAAHDSVGIAVAYNNLGAIYKDLGNLKKALEFYTKSAAVGELVNDKADMGYSYNNIGALYGALGDFNLAMTYFTKALAIRESISDKYGMANSYYSIGSLELERGNLSISNDWCEKGIGIAYELGSVELVRNNASILSQVARLKGDYQLALEMREIDVQFGDSLKNEEAQKAAIRQQTKYEFEKTQLVKEQLRSEQDRQAAEENSRRNNLQYSLIFIGILLFFGGVLSLGFIKVSPTIAEGVIFFAFLILFEFLLVLSDPFVDGLTNGEPMYKLLANALLAGLIFPAHAFFERVLKKRLVK